MEVRVAHLGHTYDAVVEEVADGGRTLVVDGRSFTLRRLTGEYVADGEPYYGVRLVLHQRSRTA
jgi:hypothetical protein